MSAQTTDDYSNATPPIVSVENVSFGYSDELVLEDISFDIEPGAFLGMVGPNGSGKSTLLELVLGLRRPNKGSVELFGESAASFDDGERIAYVAQNVAGAVRDMPVTVREAVRMGRYPCQLVGRFSETDYQAIEDALDRVGIADLADRRIGHLSGGQRQRVFIARALAAEADLLALDEPTVGVDSRSREEFYDMLADLNAEGLTVVLVEHDIGVVTTHATEVACLNRQLYFHGDPADFVETDTLSAAYGTNQHVLHHDH